MPFNGMPFREAIPYALQNSQPVSPLLYENDDFLFNVRPRISSYAYMSDRACFQIREDWKAAVGKEHSGAGCMDPVSGNFCALLFPESPDNRLFALSFVNEFLFIQDDFMDAAAQKDVNNTVKQFSWDDGKNVHADNREIERPATIKALQAKVLSCLFDVDRIAGSYIIDEVKRFAEGQAATRLFDFKNGTLEEYIELRHRDIGTYFIIACTGYSVIPTIAPSEVEHVLEITKLGDACAILCNDYWSWDKEFEDFTVKGNWPVSSVYFFMQQHNVDANTAKSMVKVKTMELAKEYGDGAMKCTAGLPLESPIVRWFALHDLVIAGNALWSMYCPRYHRNMPQLRKDEVNPHTRVADLALPPVKQRLRDLADGKDSTDERNSENSPGLSSGNTSSSSSDCPDSACLVTTTGGLLPSKRDNEMVVTEPYHYVSALPSKGLRKEILKALNGWYSLPAEYVAIIGDIIDTLHNVSLLLDDIEDGSMVRRGKPASHVIFGTSQTTNSAGYMMMLCLEKVLSLDSKACLEAYTEEMKQIYVGQGLDLHWTYLSKPPTEEEYLRSIEQKTGGLLRLMARLVQGCCPKVANGNGMNANMSAAVNQLMLLIGRYYQVRDDYEDTMSAKDPGVHIQCDLDQGNFTLPLIHLLENQKKTNSSELLSMMQTRKENKRMSPVMKHHILGLLDSAGSLEYTKKVLEVLHKDILSNLEEIESSSGIENTILRKLLGKLRI